MRIPAFLSLLLASRVYSYVVNDGTTCEIYPEALTYNGQAVDDAPSIHQAFDLCGTNGTVVFTNHTFHINSVLNTTNLVNCDVSLRGELRFSTNIPYWRSHVFSVIYQNQSTAWLFGGTNVTLRGEGGWINGNGQTWYTENKNQANQPGRPISITFFNSTNLLADGLTIIQPQFWATFVWESKNVSLTNFFVNATSDDQWDTTNTDGYDSWRSDTLLVENATITNGDDCIAAKGNTTNLLVRNVTCYGSAGMTIGSIGQYPDWPDYVQNVTFDNIHCVNSGEGAYIKTWQGVPVTDDSNGDVGGGGGGLVKNVTFSNIHMENVALPIQISQCIYSEADGKYCNTSKLQIEDVAWVNVTGTSRYNIAASLYCSSAVPCPGVTFDNVSFESVNHTLGLPMWNTTLQDEVYQCGNIVGQNSSGIPCNRVAPDNFSQGVTHNVQ
ncbi:putative exo-polygalacturonase [Talaromyces proteolyticus]|uniref:galacturonan 1,4-alpha-galacturonidase n=1 Tax=Talaromyces proteolyticus TaxID=1131652 RepID=A0AAD4Q5F1_9EURO|nr:putative exo-polygalacturonase [Talaromyces proteolyticus]KAH8704134.1 putative exo-polygalacturonase [Talaromyces proteolyticus]